MTNRFSKDKLRRMRNQIPIANLIADALNVPSKVSEGYFRFLCPICNEFITAINPKTNLARCFRCERNFNPIDFTMVVKRFNFKEAVEYLEDLANINGIEI